jgi:hypothetical protein
MWRWKHIANPFGRSKTLVATDASDRIIGLRAFLRWELLDGETRLKAVRAVDTATHPDVRRAGLFTRMTKQALDEVRDEGVSLVFNTPNDKSLPGYLKLGWREVGLVSPLVKVLSYPRFAFGLARHRISPSGDVQRSESDFYRLDPPPPAGAVFSDSSLADLIERDAQVWNGAFRTNRSIEYMRWRYGCHPTIPYRAMVSTAGGRPEGCVVFRTSNRFGLKEVVISELLLSRPDTLLARELISELRGRLRADYLVAYFPAGSFQRTALEKQGFKRTPRGGMTLATNLLDGDRPHLHAVNGWGLTLGDLEFF